MTATTHQAKGLLQGSHPQFRTTVYNSGHTVGGKIHRKANIHVKHGICMCMLISCTLTNALFKTLATDFSRFATLQ